jgi:predicted aspartyl protease
MRFACLLLLTTLSAAGQALVLQDVYLNGAGPYRMLIDTGNSSSIVRPEVARRLNLKAAYTVEHATVAGLRKVPVAILDEVRSGAVSDQRVEAMICDVFQPGVDGVLGESWLVRHDYLLDYRHRRIALDGAAAGSGVRVPLRSEDGRPAVTASIDGQAQELVVDSGASAVVLYERPTGATARLEANGGSAAGQTCRVRMSLAGGSNRMLQAVRVEAAGLGAGLLPASAFGSVYVSNREGFVEFGK